MRCGFLGTGQSSDRSRCAGFFERRDGGDKGRGDLSENVLEIVEVRGQADSRGLGGPVACSFLRDVG